MGIFDGLISSSLPKLSVDQILASLQPPSLGPVNIADAVAAMPPVMSTQGESSSGGHVFGSGAVPPGSNRGLSGLAGGVGDIAGGLGGFLNDYFRGLVPHQPDYAATMDARQKLGAALGSQTGPQPLPVNISPQIVGAGLGATSLAAQDAAGGAQPANPAGISGFNYGGGFTPAAFDTDKIKAAIMALVQAGKGDEALSLLQLAGPKAPIKLGQDESLLDPNNGYAPIATGPKKAPTFAEAPHVGINPTTGKQDQFIIGNDGSKKWLDIPPGPKINFVNGQPVDETTGLPVAGTSPIPQQAPLRTPALSPERFKQDADLAGIRAKATADNRAPQAGELPPETVKFYAEQALAGDKSVFAMVGRNQAARAQIATAVQQMGADRGLSGQDLAALNAQFVGDTQAQRTIGQRTGAIAVSGEEAKGVAGLVQAAYAKLPRSEFKPLNQLKALVDNQTNSPEQGAAYAADFALQTAYARALNPQGIPRESDIAKAGELLNTAGDSYDKHMAVVNQILKEIDTIQGSTGAARIAQINRIREQRDLGKLPESAPLQSNPKIDDLLKKYGPK